MRTLASNCRCDKCKYVADANNPGLPQIDMTTCDCWISKGEMAKGEGPVRRRRDTGEVIKDEFGEDMRDESPLQVVTNPNKRQKAIRVVRNNNANNAGGRGGRGGRRKRQDAVRPQRGAEICFGGVCGYEPEYVVEFTIEECPVMKYKNGTAKIDAVTGKKVHACGNSHSENVCKEVVRHIDNLTCPSI